MIIGKQFKFEAAHYLPNHPKCGQVHGHTYLVDVEIDGPANDETYFVMDLHDLSDIAKVAIEKYDHRTLNDFFAYPTCEEIAHQIFWEIKPCLPERTWLTKVKVQEGIGGYAIYEG